MDREEAWSVKSVKKMTRELALGEIKAA